MAVMYAQAGGHHAGCVGLGRGILGEAGCRRHEAYEAVERAEVDASLSVEERRAVVELIVVYAVGRFVDVADARLWLVAGYVVRGAHPDGAVVSLHHLEHGGELFA